MGKDIPVQVGTLYEMTVERLGHSAEGVGRIDGFTVFVPGALPGERVRLKIVTVKKNYAVGTVEKRLTDSPDRVVPRCPVYEACGGCQLQHLSYAAQLTAKRQQVIDAIERIGGLKSVLVHPVKGMEDPWHYRNKVQFPVGRVGGKIAIGCYASGSHDVIDTENCYIEREGNNDLVNAMREAVQKFGIPVYHEDRHTGVLRHVMGRVGENGDLMAVLVTAVPELRRSREIVRFLRKKLPRLVSVQQNIQTYRNNVILGRETVLLWGKPTIEDSIGQLTFHISPRSFFQVNTAQAAVLYRQALDYAALTGRETVLDVYCGTGTITLFLAQRAHRAIGIEIVAPAIRDAKKNARDNHIKNAEFLVGDATDVMPRLYRDGIRPDVIVVDPPRAGCTPTVLHAIADMHPHRIVYVSCHPASLGRDLAILTSLGYQTIEAQPVDMFPQSFHVETVVWMSREQR
ncbi:MAG: 23S rRNA (uracil(1939)-C(5))-methyltransferase RlmD [Schwartzia sp. (in: firmicutes)]